MTCFKAGTSSRHD